MEAALKKKRWILKQEAELQENPWQGSFFFGTPCWDGHACNADDYQ